MKTYESLPDGYNEIYKMNMQKNKKLSFGLNFVATVVAVILIAIPWMAGYNPLSLPLWMWWLIFGLDIVYIVLHELVHGMAMKIVGTKKVKYGFTGLYAFAGSNDYYNKKGYLFIALAPVVAIGAVLAIIQPFTPSSWFWVPWFIQLTNISGAAGDAYVTWKFSRMPKDILVTDSGIGMSVYSRENVPNAACEAA